MRSNTKRFLIGSDAELMLLYRGKAAPFEGNIKDFFGLDGATGYNRIAEIRVPATENPIEMANAIREVFRNKISKHPKTLNYDWRAGSFCLYGLGGHIHQGVSRKDVDYTFASRVIANYLGSISLLLEDSDGAYKRRNNNDGEHFYGHLTDVREKQYGFENRCFSSWLVSPAVATAHLCLAKVIMYELLNNSSFSPVERFTDSDFKKVNKEKILKHFDQIWKEISEMSLFKEYKEYLNLFPFLVKNNLSWFSRSESGGIADLKLTWGLAGNEPRSPVSQIELKHIWGNEQVAGIF